MSRFRNKLLLFIFIPVLFIFSLVGWAHFKLPQGKIIINHSSIESETIRTNNILWRLYLFKKLRLGKKKQLTLFDNVSTVNLPVKRVNLYITDQVQDTFPSQNKAGEIAASYGNEYQSGTLSIYLYYSEDIIERRKLTPGVLIDSLNRGVSKALELTYHWDEVVNESIRASEYIRKEDLVKWPFFSKKIGFILLRAFKIKKLEAAEGYCDGHYECGRNTCVCECSWSGETCDHTGCDGDDDDCPIDFEVCNCDWQCLNPKDVDCDELGTADKPADCEPSSSDCGSYGDCIVDEFCDYECDPSCPSGCTCGSNNYCCGEYCGGDGCGGSCGYESDSDVGSGCESPCSCGSNDYCCGESCGTDVCGNDCGSESDDDHWTGCDSGCSCGSNNYCCGDHCGTSVCGHDCGYESDSDSDTTDGCDSCSPACGQSAGTNVCGNSCGSCADYRSSSWNSPSGGSSFVHDMPITISGWAKDENGSNDGVDSVHVYRDGDPGTGVYITSIPANASTGSFSGNITADFYASGFTGSESHSLHLWAIKRDTNDCENWKIGQRTIYVTNNAPTNGSVTIEGTSNGALDGTDLCVDHDTDNNQIVSVTATFSDVDSYPNPRLSDIERADIIFDNDNDYSNGEFYRVRYQDDGAGGYTLSETGSGSHLDQLSILNSSAFFNDSTDTLTVDFNLDLSGIGASNYFESNIYLRAWDFAEASSSRELKASLIEFWNCIDVLVSGTVFDITSLYPVVVCDDLDPSVSIGFGNVSLSFDDLGGGESSDVSAGDGSYNVTLNYLSDYSFSLVSPSAYTYIADIRSDDLTCSGSVDCDCPYGLEIESDVQFAVIDGPVVEELDFGMVLALDQWLQVVGGDITSYGSIDDSVPSTCQNNYDNGGECLPFITVDRYTTSGTSLFSENGIPAAFGTVNWGGGSAGDPNNWYVEDNVLDQPQGQGYTYFSTRLGSDYDEPETDLSNMDLSGDPKVRLINGSMTADQDYTVAENDFALFVVSGDLTIAGDVENLHGIFLVDGNITIAGDDTSPQGLFEGIFVADANSSGAGQVSNDRDREIENNLAPSSVFEYRPDMLVSLLSDPVLVQALESAMNWEEIKP